MPGIQMENVPGMKMENESKQAAEEYAKRARMTGMNAPGQPGPRTSAEFTVPDMGSMKAPLSENVKPRLDPQVDNVGAMPTERLSSAGEGFPPGRRVLTYADPRAVYRGTDPRPPDRDIEIHLTGNKMATKLYRRHSGFPGGLKTATAHHVFRKDPTELLTKAIEGMLPKNPLGNHMAKKLRVYVGPTHPHQAQQPEPITLSLFGAGFAGAVAMRRRKVKKA